MRKPDFKLNEDGGVDITNLSADVLRFLLEVLQTWAKMKHLEQAIGKGDSSLEIEWANRGFYEHAFQFLDEHHEEILENVACDCPVCDLANQIQDITPSDITGQ